MSVYRKCRWPDVSVQSLIGVACLWNVAMRLRVVYDLRELLFGLLYFMLYTNALSNLLRKISLFLAPSSQTLRKDTIVRYINTKVVKTKVFQTVEGT